MCQLQEDYEDNKFQAGSSAEFQELKLLIAEQNIPAEEAEKLLFRHNEARKEFLKERGPRSATKNHFPSGGLPKDCVIVVRTEALRELERRMAVEPVAQAKELSPNERNSLLTIIAALCEYSAISLKERGTATQIANLAAEIGAAVSDDTVRRVLAKIPDALEARKKKA
jgi:hypothetical protein